MKLTEANPNRLYQRDQRAMAKLARIARCDVNFGGAKAKVIADRLDAMGSTIDYYAVVSEAYGSSTGAAIDYLAYKCPECGNVVMGAHNAQLCCMQTD